MQLTGYKEVFEILLIHIFGMPTTLLYDNLMIKRKDEILFFLLWQRPLFLSQYSILYLKYSVKAYLLFTRHMTNQNKNYFPSSFVTKLVLVMTSVQTWPFKLLKSVFKLMEFTPLFLKSYWSFWNRQPYLIRICIFLLKIENKRSIYPWWSKVPC